MLKNSFLNCNIFLIMDASLFLLISIAIILFILWFRKNVALGILIGAFFFGFLTLKTLCFQAFLNTILAKETFRLIIIILSAFTLGFSMQELGLLKTLSQAIEFLTGKNGILLLPMLVGLMPMPGGALISAIMIKELCEKYHATPEEATFVNYWCRHLWVPIWPLYPSFVLGASILGIHYYQLCKAGIFVTFSMLLSLPLFMKKFFSPRVCVALTPLKSLIFSIYPLFIIIFLALIMHIDLAITLPITILILFLHKKPSFSKTKIIFKKTLDLEIVLLIIGVLFYKKLILQTGAAALFLRHLTILHIPIPLAAFVLAWIIGFAVGIEVGFAAIVLPFLLSFIGEGAHFNPLNFILVFGGGFTGIMLSPMHLCLILTAKYYKASLPKVYRSLSLAGLTTSLSIWGIYLLFSFS